MLMLPRLRLYLLGVYAGQLCSLRRPCRPQSFTKSHIIISDKNIKKTNTQETLSGSSAYRVVS